MFSSISQFFSHCCEDFAKIDKHRQNCRTKVYIYKGNIYMCVSSDFHVFLNLAILFTLLRRFRNKNIDKHRQNCRTLYITNIACILWEDSIFAKISQKCTRLRAYIYIHIYIYVSKNKYIYIYLFVGFESYIFKNLLYIYIYNLYYIYIISSFCEIFAILQNLRNFAIFCQIFAILRNLRNFAIYI